MQTQQITLPKELKYQPKAFLNNICPYFTMFPLEFPYHILAEAGARDVVFDPFCGRGTTLYAARLHQLKAFGIDSNPVAVAISDAKQRSSTKDRVVKALTDILAAAIRYRSPSGPFWRRAYHPDTLRNLSKVRRGLLEDCACDERTILRAIILGSLHGPQSVHTENSGYFSNQMQRTFAPKPDYALKFWKNHKCKPEFIKVQDVVAKRAARYLNDDLPAISGGGVYVGDARDEKAYGQVEGVTWIITSPPYYGLRTYITDQWLRYWFLGGPPRPAYESDRQLDHGSPEKFAYGLSRVWDNCARVAENGTTLIVRFGGIKSRTAAPLEILKKSFDLAQSRWVQEAIKPAGSASSGKRQALQMRKPGGPPTDEFDMELRLKK